jgi:hypothetical protein
MNVVVRKLRSTKGRTLETLSILRVDKEQQAGAGAQSFADILPSESFILFIYLFIHSFI